MALDEDLVREVSCNEVKKLLVDLAIHYSDKTEVQVVPVKTINWKIEVYDKDNISNPCRTINIQLIHFFGMFVGYDSELDLLVMWKI